MEKNYQVKTYWFDGVYKQTISPVYFMSDILFSSQINWGLWEFNLRLSLPMNTTTFSNSDVLKIYCFDENNLSWRLIYTGVINRIKRFLEPNWEYIELTCVGMYSFLQRLYFKSGWNYEFTLDQDPSQTIKDMVDYFNSIYSANWFSYSEVDTYWEDISIDFNYRLCNDVVKDIQKITSTRFFYIDADWSIKYKDSAWTLTNHKLKIENQIDSMTIDEEIESLSNNVFAKYWWDTAWPFADATSQSEYGQIDEKVSASWVSTLDSATIYWEEFLAENKDKKKQTILIVNSKYDIESIKPGDTITIFNTDYELEPMLVNRIQYSFSRVVLSLDRYETFAETILSNNE